MFLTDNEDDTVGMLRIIGEELVLRKYVILTPDIGWTNISLF